jgi:hypothetical protein
MGFHHLDAVLTRDKGRPPFPLIGANDDRSITFNDHKSMSHPNGKFNADNLGPQCQSSSDLNAVYLPGLLSTQ